MTKELNFDSIELMDTIQASFAEPTPVEFVLPFPVQKVLSVHVNGVEKPVESTMTIKPCTNLEVSLALD